MRQIPEALAISRAEHKAAGKCPHPMDLRTEYTPLICLFPATRRTLAPCRSERAVEKGFDDPWSPADSAIPTVVVEDAAIMQIMDRGNRNRTDKSTPPSHRSLGQH